MQKPSSRAFTKKLDLTREQLHVLLNKVAMRAYEKGYRDGVGGLPHDPDKARISKRSIDKIP